MMTFKHLAKILVASRINWHVDYLELRKMTQKELKSDMILCLKGDFIC